MIAPLKLLSNRLHCAGKPLLVSLCVAALWPTGACDAKEPKPPKPEQPTEEKLADAGFLLEGLKMWGPAFEEPELQKEYNELNASSGSADADERIDVLREKTQSAIAKHRDALYASAKEVNAKMRFRAGLARDADPTSFFDEWVVFRLNAFRLGISENNLGKLPPEERLLKAGKILETAERFGGVAVVQGGGRPWRGDKTMSGGASYVFTNDFIPLSKVGLNSAEVRAVSFSNLETFASFISRFPALNAIKMGNEPFWTQKPVPVLDFGQATVGCNAETFQKHVRRTYPDFAAWRAAVDGSISGLTKEAENKRNRAMGGVDDIGKAIGWTSFEDMGVPPEAITGLTFVGYLKSKYGTLESLNNVWFGKDQSKWFSSWETVFPPLPVIGKARKWTNIVASQKADIPEEEVVPEGGPSARAPKGMEAAWVDWLSFQPCAISNYYVSAAKNAKEKTGVKQYITTNCITGHFINDFKGNAAICGLNPWDTPAGLDTLAIDFYTISYLQGYMRALAGAANGRPIQIHEGGGSSGKDHKGKGAKPSQVAYMTLYTFAHGAEMLLFWRRDAKLEPILEIEIAKAMKAMSDQDLQWKSQPLTDGVGLVYSQDSLYLAQAMDGSAQRMILPFQAGLRMALRLHLLYDLYSDRKLAAEGIPDHIKVLVLPGAFSVSDQLLGQIETFVKRGGKVVVGSSFAEYGDHARARQRPAWLGSPNVMTVPEADWIAWNDNFLDADDPTASDVKSPEWIAKADQFIAATAPRTVSYLDKAGAPSKFSIAGARKSDSALYVFVNPGANDVTLKVAGNYKSAVELYSGKPLSVNAAASETKVSGVSGPAIVRLIKASTPSTP